MATLRFFYADYCEDKAIPSEEAWTRSKDEILHSMDCVLHVPRNFCGIIDDNDVTLQFMVNDDRSVHVEVPASAERGSYATTMKLEECLELVRSLGDTIQRDLVPGLQFEAW